MSNQPVVFEDDPSIPNVIELKNINQSYDDGKTNVIKDMNLLIENEVGQNQFIAVLGASGCGKSTILRYISGLQVPTSGEILLYGKPSKRDTIVGMVFQKYSSLPWLNVLDNVALGLEFQGVPKKERHERAMEMIQTVGLDGHEDKFAKYPILSGGQLQRVAIARSLLASPKILLMDEPFGALDIQTRLKMQDMLRSIVSKMHDMAVIFVTHDIAEAIYLADEVLIMKANPGQFVDRIKLSLPKDRTREIKRESKFIREVYEIEDKMTSLNKR